MIENGVPDLEEALGWLQKNAPESHEALTKKTKAPRKVVEQARKEPNIQGFLTELFALMETWTSNGEKPCKYDFECAQEVEELRKKYYV